MQKCKKPSSTNSYNRCAFTLVHQQCVRHLVEHGHLALLSSQDSRQHLQAERWLSHQCLTLNHEAPQQMERLHHGRANIRLHEQEQNPCDTPTTNSVHILYFSQKMIQRYLIRGRLAGHSTWCVQGAKQCLCQRQGSCRKQQLQAFGENKHLKLRYDK